MCTHRFDANKLYVLIDTWKIIYHWLAFGLISSSEKHSKWMSLNVQHTFISCATMKKKWEIKTLSISLIQLLLDKYLHCNYNANTWDVVNEFQHICLNLVRGKKMITKSLCQRLLRVFFFCLSLSFLFFSFILFILS